MNTGTPGNVGTKNIYDSTGSYIEQTESLVTAEQFNTAVQNAIDSEFECVGWNPNDSTDCWFVKIRGTTDKPSGKNLFNKNNRTRLYGWFPYTGSPFSYTPNGYANRIPCKPNTTYTARYNGTSTQAVLNFGSTRYDTTPASSDIYYVGCTNSIRLEHPTKDTPVTITTGPNDKWLIVQYNVTEPQNTDMANNLQIEEGAVATAYEPYQNLYLPSGN